MSYSIEGNGGGPVDPASAQDAFRALVRELDAATPSGGAFFTGSIAGFEETTGYKLDAAEVRNEDRIAAEG